MGKHKWYSFLSVVNNQQVAILICSNTHFIVPVDTLLIYHLTTLCFEITLFKNITKDYSIFCYKNKKVSFFLSLL